MASYAASIARVVLAELNKSQVLRLAASLALMSDSSLGTVAITDCP